MFRVWLCLLLLPSLAPAQSTSSGVDLKALDPAVSACDNFYQYACGTWRNNNPIPPDRARWSRFAELQEHNLAIERDILEKSAVSSPARTPVEQKIGDFYASCMDEAAIEAKGVKPIEPTLALIAAASSKQELLNTVVRLHKDGVRVLFTFGVRPDAKDASNQIAAVDQGGIAMPDRDYYTKTDARSLTLRTQYEEHVRAMFDLLDKAQGRIAPNSTAREKAVMTVETALAKASLQRVQRRNPDNTYHIMTVDALSALNPDFAWKKYLAEIGIAPIKTLNVAVPDFIKSMNSLLESASLDDLKAYFTWHVLNSNADLLNKAFQNEEFRFTGKILSGTQEMQPRWKRCVESTDRALGEALGQKYVEVAFSGPSKAKVLQLVGEIEKEMERDIKEAAWMSAATKDQAYTKLQKVSNKIGYPEKWRDYTTVTIARGDYFGDSKRVREFNEHRNLEKLGKPVDKSEWNMTPPTVNAYYSPPMNNINFPAGILQPPFYNAKADDAVNYGAIGVVIGHELTHGFDDQGRRFDGSGNLRDWWTAEDGKNFETRAGCISQEYSGFASVEGANLNGKLTLGENSADNGGIHLAYMALMDSLAGKVLPKKDGYTPQQQFFLGYAQVWCENRTEESSRLSAQTDPHSPGQFRVNGVVSNLPEFREAFSCKAGDKMVSTDPCRVW